MRDKLNRYTLKRLRSEVSKSNISNYSKLKKADLITLMIKNKERFQHLLKEKSYLSTVKRKPPMKPKPKPKKEPVKRFNTKFQEDMAKKGIFINEKVIKKKKEFNINTFKDLMKKFMDKYKNLKNNKDAYYRNIYNNFNSSDFIDQMFLVKPTEKQQEKINDIIRKSDYFKAAQYVKTVEKKKLEIKKIREKEMKNFSNKGVKKLRDFLDKKGFKYLKSIKSAKTLKKYYIENYSMPLQKDLANNVV